MLVQTDNFGHSNAYKSEFCEREYHYPMHVHQYAEIVYVYSGTLILKTAERTEEIHDNSYAVIMPFQAHKLDTVGTATILISVFSESLISDFISGNSLVCGEKCSFTPSDELKHFALKQLEIKGTYLGCDYNDIRLLRKLKSAIYAIFEEYFSKVKITKLVGENDMLSKMLMYIYEHFSENITLAKMAQSFGYNPNYISHCFKSVIGMNFCSFTNCVRIEKSKNLLLTTNMSASEISAVCGFSSERNYHRVFKSVTGTTPTEYRGQKAI